MKVFHKGKTLAATLLNIVGLTFAFAAFYIIIVQVHYDLTYNSGIKDHERIYLMSCAYSDGKQFPFIARPTGESIIKGMPIVENGGIVMVENGGYDTKIYFDDESNPVIIKTSNATLEGLKTIGYELVEGSWNDWIDNSLALSESCASRLGVHAGDNLKLKSSERKIAAIYKDIPGRSDFTHDGFFNLGNKGLDVEDNWSYNYFVKFQPGLSKKEISDAIDSYLKKWLSEDKKLSTEKVDDWIDNRGIKIFSLQEMYSNPTVLAIGAKGNKTTTMTLLGVAVLIIIIALINYFNFFFALIPVKLKDINTRKILGSSRISLVLTMVLESVCYIITALGLAAVIVLIFSRSPYSEFISTSLIFKYNWGITFITIGAGIVIGVLSALLPAIYITSFNPAVALKGFIKSYGRGNTFRNGLIGFQFTISIILVICAIVIHQQREYMLDYDLGFNTENLYTVTVGQVSSKKHETIENRLKESPVIEDVTWAQGDIIADFRNGWGREFNGKQISFDVYPVAWNFLQFMKIPVVEGRDFIKSDEEVEGGLFIFTTEARDNYNLKIGDRFRGHSSEDNPAEVIGFTGNINYKPLTAKGIEFAFYQYGKQPWSSLYQMYVRAQPFADPETVEKTIIETLKEIDPEINANLLEVKSFNIFLDNLYGSEKNLSILINLFTLLAIVISLMGVFGLVMFDTERRKKEIGVRRVNGATVEEILAMFNMKFIKIVIVSFIIAVPVSWWIIRVYLESYAYKTPIYVWVFFVALLAVLIITTGVVTLRSYRAATSNPVESLRTE